MSNETSETINVQGAPITLARGDSLEIMPALEPGSVDVIVTSPPYNLSIGYRSYDDKQTREAYLKWMDSFFLAAEHVLDPEGGSLFLNIGGKPSDPWGPFEVATLARQHFVLQNVIHWVKSISIDDAPCVGHVKPINSPRFVNDAVELVLHLTKSGEVPLDRTAPGLGVAFADKSNLTRGTRGKNGDSRCRGNAWFCPYETIQSRADDRPHPATFPPRLAEMAFRLHGLSRIRRTMDPFSGLGSTARASAKLGLAHLGIEIDPIDHAEAVRRVKTLAGAGEKPPAGVACAQAPAPTVGASPLVVEGGFRPGRES